jgi:metal-responsive CopG/Arc/MetJ family transcriptional regulator
MGKTIPLSFRDEEEYMIQEIDKLSQYTSRSGWIKQAIAEKLAREKNEELKVIDAILKQK